MNEEKLKKEFEQRNLKYQNKQLINRNALLNNQYNNLHKSFETKVEKEVKKRLIPMNDKLKAMTLRAKLAEDRENRLKLEVVKKENEIQDKKATIDELQQQLEKLRKENERLKGIQNIDGTNSGMPTSMTPIGKKKVIPNFGKTTGESIGRKKGHKKDKLEAVSEEMINKHVEQEMNTCPNCNKKDIERTGKIIKKQVKDYKITVEYTEHDFIEYKCKCCGKTFHKEIPNHLKEECQYGSNLKSLILTLTNVGNVALNKQKRIISGLSIGQIEPCEGYLAKLQKQASRKLEKFIEELRKGLIASKMVYWDDTVISINGKQSCMRYYGNENMCLFKAHEKKNKEGIDKDNILKLLSSNTVVEHDHNKVNYNPEYSFINAECCQHLLRDLKKVSDNIPKRTWSKNLIEMFQKYDHKRNELISKKIDSFNNEEINEFIITLDNEILKGLEENEEDETKPYYTDKELALLNRLMEYRDNYIYWIFDFKIPFTNNLSERNLRGIKSKMKISGQFQNIERASDYANIRSYIETCRLYGVNEYESLTRLVEDNPYTLVELQQIKNK